MLIEYEPNKCFNTKQIVTIDIEELKWLCREPNPKHCINISCEGCPYLFVVPYTIVIRFTNGTKRTIERDTKDDVDSLMELLKYGMSLCNEPYFKIEQIKDQ